jgi:hypothetical protein
MEDGKMSLATKIETIEGIEGLSQKTRDKALMEVIEHYRTVILPAHTDILQQMEYARPLQPALEKVIAGETTYKAEFERLGPVNFLLYGNMEITGGNFEMEEQIAIVDRTIERLYRPDRTCKHGKSAVATIKLDLKALSGQHRLKK